MKKFLFMAVAAIAALSSCSNNDEFEPKQTVKQGLVFTASMEGAPETRATYDGTYKCASWEVDDRISINGFDYKANNAGTSTTFSESVNMEEIRPVYISSANTESYSNQPAENLVDDDGVDTRWIADKSQRVAGAWNIVVSTGQPVYLKSIKLWNYDNASYPNRRWKTMRLYGSTTTQDDEWEEISDPAPLTSSHPFNNLNLAINNRELAGEIAVNSTKAYTFYRIDVLDNEGDNYMQMSDMKFVVTESETLEPPYTAYFPADLYQQEHLVLPSRITETWADGKFNMPMYAHSESTDLQFKNLCGVLKIIVKNDRMSAVKSIRVSSKNRAVSGAFTVNSDNVAVLTSPDNTDNTVTITYSSVVPTTAEGTVFYVAIPAQTYRELTIGLSSDGESFTKSMTTKADQDITVARKTIYPITFKGQPTTGTAKATIDGEQVDVNWVQLWAGGPKFAEYNVGASSATDGGHAMEFTDAAETGSNYVWGANWCTPSYDQMNELLLAAQGNSGSKVTCEYTTGDDIWGFKFTGKETGYTSNSVFFPAEDGRSDAGVANYWSATDNGSEAWEMNLHYEASVDGWFSNWDSSNPYFSGFVRPVLKN